MLGDEALSKDALQECLIKVWKNAGSFDHKKARLFTWLLRIARNTAIDKLRVEGRRSEVMIQNQDSNVNKVEQGLNIDHIDIHKHIHELDVKYSKVIYALFFRGLTQEEASKSLEIPVGTVKSRLRIGLRELKINLSRSVGSFDTNGTLEVMKQEEIISFLESGALESFLLGMCSEKEAKSH